MRTPREIYAQYKIIPSLQLHQLRVAAVAKLICENFKQPINTREVVLACLFHDMGNIIKFDLATFPEFTKPEGVGYWEGVKTEYRAKYGTDHHAASQTIAREIGLSETVVGYIGLVGFSHALEVLESDSFEKKICEYSDMRVGPHGVLSLEDRIADGRKRYITRKESVSADWKDQFERLKGIEEKLEKQVFAETTTVSEDINDTAVAPIIEELWEYEVA